MFGQGATYDSIKGQCRKYHNMADELRADAAKQGKSIAGTPRGRGKTGSFRTPREAQNRVTKSLSASSTKDKTRAVNYLATPTKQDSLSQIGDIQMEDGNTNTRASTSAINVEREPMDIIPSIEEAEFKPYPVDNMGSFVGVVIPTKGEVTAVNKGKETTQYRRSQAPPCDSESDEYVDSRENSPSTGRGRARTRHPRTASATTKYAGYDFGFADEEHA